MMSQSLWIPISEGQLRAKMDTFSECYRGNCLDFNASKTKELVRDLRHGQFVIPTLEVSGQAIQRLEAYKHLGTRTDQELTFNHNSKNHLLQMTLTPLLSEETQ